MAQACTTCGGVGRGTIDPEFGWRKGTERGSNAQPAPCPVCQGNFDDRFESGEYDTVDPKTGKLRKYTGEKPELGPYRDPQARKTRDRTVAVVDGDTYSDQEFDPGFVNTGRESVSLDDAPAMAGAGEE